MDSFQIAALLITITALFSYINFQYIGLPGKIGVMAIALAVSLILLISGWLGVSHGKEQAAQILSGIEFNRTLLHGMLAFLLFAAAQQLDFDDLRTESVAIVSLSTVSVVVSTVVVGAAVWAMLQTVGIKASVPASLLFGALISPTDPIAVVGIMKNAHAPKSLETQISGESVFNDGIGVVVFLVVLGLATTESSLSVLGITSLFLEEAIGGLLFGLAAGYLTYLMLKQIDHYQVEILLTLALSMGVYALAEALPISISAPIAEVAAGLVIGNTGRALAMSPITREHVDTFWELVDEILNAVLFVLIGLEVLAIPLKWGFAFAALVAIPITLVARFISVATVVGSLSLVRRFIPGIRPFIPGTIPVLTWGGLRGGISVALALSLPAIPERDAIITITYAVVIFSILVQGLTVGGLTEYFVACGDEAMGRLHCKAATDIDWEK